MIHLGQLKLRALIKPLAGLAASAMLIGAGFAFGSLKSHADVQPVAVAYAPMQPVIQTEPTLPKMRPDPALAYGRQTVDIALPQETRLKDILPISTATLAEMIKAQTGHDYASEKYLSYVLARALAQF